MSTKNQLDGNEPSWVNENWYGDGKTIVGYVTNFGMVEINQATGEVESAVIGVGRNQGNTQLSIKLIDNEFQVFKDTFNTIWAELCSPDFPYKKNPSQSIGITEVLQVLQEDDNFSVAAIAVKKRLIWLMVNKLKFTTEERKALGRLLKAWRKPITKEDLKEPVKRTPIITRTPIIRR